MADDDMGSPIRMFSKQGATSTRLMSSLRLSSEAIFELSYFYRKPQPFFSKSSAV